MSSHFQLFIITLHPREFIYHLHFLYIFLTLLRLINTVIIRFEKEVPTAVASSRMFKAYILDSHNLLPKLEHLRASSSLKEMEVWVPLNYMTPEMVSNKTCLNELFL